MRYINLLESEFLTDKDKIIEWINQSFMEFKPNKLVIESDGLIYNGNLALYSSSNSLEVNFKSVTGYFYLCYSDIFSLEGCSQSVGGDFNCGNTNITSLKFCPKLVGHDFFCPTIKITDPKEYRFTLYCEIGGEFYSSSKEINDIINTYRGSVNKKHWPLAINLLSKVKL